MTLTFQSPVRARLMQSAVVFLALLLTAASVPTGTAEQAVSHRTGCSGFTR